MTNAKHTPEFFRDQYGHVYVWRDTDEGKRSEILIDNRHSEATNEEKTLIAASPDLLAALEALLWAVRANNEGGTPKTQDQIFAEAGHIAIAAIAKAKGE